MDDTTEKPPVEGKVYAATVGSGVGLVLGPFVLWLLGVLFWNVPSDAAHAEAAIGAVPFPVNGIIILAIGSGITFLAGYKTKHTPRPAPTTDNAVITEQDPTVIAGQP